MGLAAGAAASTYLILGDARFAFWRSGFNWSQIGASRIEWLWLVS
jgi:hypothetical protein